MDGTSKASRLWKNLSCRVTNRSNTAKNKPDASKHADTPTVLNNSGACNRVHSSGSSNMGCTSDKPAHSNTRVTPVHKQPGSYRDTAQLPVRPCRIRTEATGYHCVFEQMLPRQTLPSTTNIGYLLTYWDSPVKKCGL